MAGRRPKLNWTPCFNQYTCTINGEFHRLGKDKKDAQEQFEHYLRQAALGRDFDPNITFKEVADNYLDHVEAHHTAERYRHCKQRLQEFEDFVGAKAKAREIQPEDVEEWLAGRELSKSSERLYKSIILACLNWAARPRSKDGGELLHRNPLRGQLKLPAGESWGKEAVWTPETYEQVLRVCSPAFADLVRILAWTGARITTIIQIEARHYNKAQSRWDCEDLSRERGTKRVKHIRLLTAEARELVERLNADHPVGPIFRNSFGKPWDADAPQIYLTNLKKKFQATKILEWQPGLAVSGLRHTFATRFLQAYPNELEYLRVLLGHSTYKMIFAHYSGLIDQDHAAFKRLEGFKPY
jgi:integrase